MNIRPLLLILFCAGAMLAQTTTAGSVQSSGNATIPVKPDQAQLIVSVVTQSATAQDAGQQNAILATTVIAALNSVVGANGSVQTIGYSVYPRYNTNSIIVGYTATNTVQATTNDISNVGRLIDTANAAGASNVGGITFGLQDPEPVKLQALTKAGQQALTHASAIAAGVGRKTGAVISAEENSTYAPVVTGGIAAAAPTTPVQPGTVTVTANVTVTVALQ